MNGVGRTGAFFLYDRYESHGNVKFHRLARVRRHGVSLFIAV